METFLNINIALTVIFLISMHLGIIFQNRTEPYWLEEALVGLCALLFLASSLLWGTYLITVFWA